MNYICLYMKNKSIHTMNNHIFIIHIVFIRSLEFFPIYIQSCINVKISHNIYMYVLLYVYIFLHVECIRLCIHIYNIYIK